MIIELLFDLGYVCLEVASLIGILLLLLVSTVAIAFAGMWAYIFVVWAADIIRDTLRDSLAPKSRPYRKD